MGNLRMSGHPSQLRRFLTPRKAQVSAVVVPLAASALTITVVTTAAAAPSGIETVCIPQNIASDRKGGFNDPVPHDKTQTRQRTSGGVRQQTLWQGLPAVGCPATAVEPCVGQYTKGDWTTYHKVINITGGIVPGGGGQPFPVPFPFINFSLYLKNESRTIKWDVSLSHKIAPGHTSTPTLAVDYQVQEGDFVGAYHFVERDRDCNRYYLEPNEEFGYWKGEFASKEYITWLDK
jgi:hypothetical protein